MNTQERINHPTPNGGGYSIGYFKDKDGNPCQKSKAVAIEIVEFSEDDQEITRTYLKKG